MHRTPHPVAGPPDRAPTLIAAAASGANHERQLRDNGIVRGESGRASACSPSMARHSAWWALAAISASSALRSAKERVRVRPTADPSTGHTQLESRPEGPHAQGGNEAGSARSGEERASQRPRGSSTPRRPREAWAGPGALEAPALCPDRGGAAQRGHDACASAAQRVDRRSHVCVRGTGGVGGAPRLAGPEAQPSPPQLPS